MKSWVVITCEHTYPYKYKSVYYSGPQLDDGTLARCQVEQLNHQRGLLKNKYILHIWDMRPYGGRIQNAPESIKREIRKACTVIR